MTDKEKFYEIWKNVKREGADKILAYLEKSDYFSAPASTRFHNAVEGGLLNHSLGVYEELLDLTNKNNLVWQDQDSIAIIALLHDICKTNFYKIDYRNQKNENGVWEKKPFYAIDDKMPIGIHGDKSVMIIQSLGMILTREESYCIRYHMGAYEGEKVFQNINLAKRKCENIIWTCLADELSTLKEELRVL